MTFRPINDKQAGITSRTFSTFRGTHTAYSSVDMPDEFAYVCDVDCDDEKLTVRPGFKKIESGNTATVEKVFQVELGGVKSLASVVNGSLSLRPLTDILSVVMAVLLSCLTPCVTTGATLYVFPSNKPLSYKELNTNFALLNVETTGFTNYLAVTGLTLTATATWASNTALWASNHALFASNLVVAVSNANHPRSGIWGMDSSKTLLLVSAILEPEAGFWKMNSAGQIVLSTNWWTDAWWETNAAGQVVMRSLP